jgi:hypothetical protein
MNRKMKYRIRDIRNWIGRKIAIDQCAICWGVTRTHEAYKPIFIDGVVLDVNIRACVECVPVFDWQGIPFG